MNDASKRCLIIKPSALGDVILALPALSRLRRLYPEAGIDWMIRPELAPLLQDHPYLDQLILFDRKALGSFWPPRPWLARLRALLRTLKSGHYDVVYDMQGLLRTAILSRATGAPVCMGLAQAREGAVWFYTSRIAQEGTSKHVIDLYLRMVDPEHTPGDAQDIEYGLPDHAEARTAVAARFRENALEEGRYIVIVPGSAHADKCWPRERFVDLIGRLDQAYQMPVVLVGSQGEVTAARELEKAVKGRLVNWVGRTSLPELHWVLAGSHLVIANDTGPGHLAVALGVPLVMMFSWSNPARIYPYGRPECMVARDPFTRPSGIRSRDPKHNIDQIQVEEVWEKVQEQMGQVPERSPSDK